MSDKKVEIYPDETLLDLLKSGKKSAFDLIYNKYWEPMFVYTVKVVKDEEAAQDIIQEVFVSFWSRKDKLVIDNLQSYLFSAVRYKSISYIKNNLNKHHYHEDLSNYLDVKTTNFEQDLNAKELAKIIDQQVRHLPDKMREIYQLSRQEMLSHKEIADRLSISDKTVKKQINNALKIFKIKLSDLYLFVFLCKYFLDLSTT